MRAPVDAARTWTWTGSRRVTNIFYALQITKTKKLKKFSPDSGTLIPVEWTFFVQNVGNEIVW